VWGIVEDLDLDVGDCNPEEDHADVPISAPVNVSKILNPNLPNLQDVNNTYCVNAQSIVEGVKGSFEAKNDPEDIQELKEIDIDGDHRTLQDEADEEHEEDEHAASQLGGCKFI
jgi:hypothetical protein